MAKALTLLLLMFGGLLPAQAQVARDPTQPPAAFAVNVKNAPETDAAESEVAGRVLQSVIRRHGAKPVAIINGQSLRLGDKIDDFVLVKLTETEATLKGPAGTEMLLMSPAVDKKLLRPARTVR